ncbi:hypothetical protein QJS04_geneDACA024057 [Acorus gramineus]|uniref:Uncharacterized protein n=1 Tax=Acorus gramineus TaxID=55184 RepID=A0AAV9A430_ACOGR|nr:hypothetical protein QJS04_geneDACA024057 [Acorus gramineus]
MGCSVPLVGSGRDCPSVRKAVLRRTHTSRRLPIFVTDCAEVVGGDQVAYGVEERLPADYGVTNSLVSPKILCHPLRVRVRV